MKPPGRGPARSRLRAALAALPLVLVASTVRADGWIGLSGNYYKERSTRVIEPIITGRVNLPHDVQLDLGYAVDQVTSASSATTVTDELFNEYRHELRVAARIRLWELLTPGLRFRFSRESDYTSINFGGDLSLDLFDKTTTLSAFAQYQTDTITQRERAGFRDGLDTLALGVSGTQVINKYMIGGLSAEVQLLDGYQENPYRPETHPRDRTRWAFSGWLAGRVPVSRTTVRGQYRFYVDSWDLVGHTVELKVTQEILPGLEIAPLVRVYSQSGVFFVSLTDNFVTFDPKLFQFASRTYGAQISWQQRWLRGTWLDPLADAWIEPAYYYLDTEIQYGAAHIAQLNGYIPW